MPEDFQIMLLNETTYGGLNTASCALIGSIFTFTLLIWLFIVRHAENQKLIQAKVQHEQFLIVENNLKKSIFAKQTFEAELSEMTFKLEDFQQKLEEKDEKLKNLMEVNMSNASYAQSSGKDLEKARANEQKYYKELTTAKLELANFKERFEMQQNDYQIRYAEFDRLNNDKIESMSRQLAEKSTALSVAFEEANELRGQIDKAGQIEKGM